MKPESCPFCGESATQCLESWNELCVEQCVECGNCGARGPLLASDIDDKELRKKQKVEIVEEWNTRTQKKEKTP